MGETIQLRTTFSTYFSYIFAAAAVFASVYLAITDVRELTASVPFLLAAGIGVWVIFGYPKVEVAGGGITVVNVVSKVHVPWPCYRGVSTDWNLRIDSEAGTITAWALPMASGTARRWPRRGGQVPGGGNEPMRSTAQGGALIIAERFAELTDAGFLSGATLQKVSVTRGANWVTIAGIGACAVLVAIGLL